MTPHDVAPDEVPAEEGAARPYGRPLDQQPGRGATDDEAQQQQQQ